jgi:hypothetical protein
MHRRGRAGEIVNLVNLDIQRKGHVVPDQLEMGIVQQMGYIVLGAAVKIIDAQNVAFFFFEKALAQMRTQKTRAAGNKNPFAIR